jgi:hypothetical protein
MSAKLFAEIPFTVKSLACTVAGSTPPLTLTMKSVGAVPVMTLPQTELVTEQPVGVGVGVKVAVGVGVGLSAAAQYLPPVFKEPLPSSPPQTIISLPVHTAV